MQLEQHQWYKDSEIGWIGSIPKHWYLNSLKRFFSNIGSGTTPNSTKMEYYKGGSINWVVTGDLNDNVLRDNKHKITPSAITDFSSLKIYPIGTLLIAMYGATIGKTSILGVEACTNQACCALQEGPDIINTFAFYWVLAHRNYIINLSVGGGQPNISQTIIKEIFMALPPRQEQQEIIDFLDKKTALVDKKIEYLREKIRKYEELRMTLINQTVTKGLNLSIEQKETGLDWMRYIPKHWSLSRIKDIYFVLMGFNCNTNLYSQTGIPLIRMSNISHGKVNITKAKMVPNNSAPSKFLLRKHDVLIGLSGSIENYAYVEESNLPLYLNQRVGCIRSQASIDYQNRFLYYFVQTASCKTVIQLQAQGTAQRNISPTDIANLFIPVPPHKEQQEIVKFLDSKTAIIDAIIHKTKIQIELHQEYRQALIHDLVTGKKIPVPK